MHRPAYRTPRAVKQGPPIERRTFIALVSGGLLAAPLGAAAQPAKLARIGYLSSSTATLGAALRKAFIDGLQEHGWTDGKNIVVESRWDAPGKTLDSNAAELARLPLDAIVAVNTPAAIAMKRTATTLPVVFATVSEPIVTGLVGSLAHPGNNFTGLTTINRELMAKRLEVLKQAIPGLARIGYLANPGYAVHQAQLVEMTATARGLGLTLHLAEARAPSELEGAFARVAAAQAGALIVQQDELFRDHLPAIVELARRHRLPDMYVFSIYPRAGGLMSYGANVEDLYRRAAGYVDRILKGAKPSELPVERPSKFELVINLKTAKALGLAIPQSLLLQAEQVIE
jgi:putative ABC transport system substrate-binding protein